MIYENIVKGVFLERPNRFIARCLIEGAEETVHVKNTGRCRELLVKNAEVYLQKSQSPKRKTAYSLITVNKGGRFVNMDSQAPNKAVLEAFLAGVPLLEGLEGSVISVKTEKVYGSSRFDFYIETLKNKAFVEVKGVTLEKENVALFPDAPTERGLKHALELAKAVKDGFAAYILFVIQMKNPNYFTPNGETHAEFAQALEEAEKEGVRLLARDCRVAPHKIELADPVKILLRPSHSSI